MKPKPDTTTLASPGELNLYHRNPRRGDIPAIAASLRKHHQYKPLTGNIGTLTGRPYEILAGNHTLIALRELAAENPEDPAWQSVKVHWGDWDDDTCKTIVLADNRTAELGGFDTGELLALLNDMPAVDLAGVGYSADDMADLRAMMEERGPSIADILGETQDADLADTGASYADRLTTRTLVLAYPIPQFIWAQEQLEKIRKDFNVETNAEAVMALIGDYSGEPIPRDARIEA